MTTKSFEVNDNEFEKAKKKPYGHTQYQRKTPTGKLAQVPAKGVKPPKQAQGTTEYIVTAQSFDRNTGKPTAEQRDEKIDIKTNELFAHAKNTKDIKAAYESFWNDLNPKSKDVVKVVKVQPAHKVDKVGKADVENWLGSDNTLSEAIDALYEIANGRYEPKLLAEEILALKDE